MHNPERTGATLTLFGDSIDVRGWTANLGDLNARRNYQKPQIFLIVKVQLGF